MIRDEISLLNPPSSRIEKDVKQQVQEEEGQPETKAFDAFPQQALVDISWYKKPPRRSKR
jgi:hypothetical protein